MSYNYNEYTSTSFSGGGGGEEGGYTRDGNQQQSPSATKAPRDDSLRPVTIKQINEAEASGEANFKLDGHTISQVTFVGKIVNVSTQTTNTTYKVDDGTGTIEAKRWQATDAMDDGQAQKLGQDQYVRVYGKLKTFGDRRHVGADVIRPISDNNEVSYHMLESTLVHLQLTRGPIGGSGANSGGANNDAGHSKGASLSSGGFALPSGLSGSARKVFQCISTTPQGNEGLHCDDIASRIKMNAADVMAAAEELQDHTLIYSTIDDSTWAILNTDGMAV